MNNDPILIKSNITGGHYALKTDKSKKPFENLMGVYTKIKLLPDDIVADIGAYIGEYSLWCINQNVKRVISYEPTPATFEVLKMNKRGNMELVNKAVVGGDQEFIDLFISKGIGVINSTVKSYYKSGSIKVPAIKYECAIVQATVVKIDVEGAEYAYNIIQPQLRAIILEFHPISKRPWLAWAEVIMDKIESSGFRRVVKPTFKSGWNLTGCWER